MVSVSLMHNQVHTFPSRWILVKDMSRKFHGLCEKGVEDSVKVVIFLGFIMATEIEYKHGIFLCF